VSIALARLLLRWSKIEISTRGIECHQVVDLVLRWSDIYREHREYISTRGEWGRGRRSKGMDRCPLTSPPLQKCSITTCEDLQEVTRSALGCY
jgi:hypothetical protein